MKKFLVIMIALAMLLAFTACGATESSAPAAQPAADAATNTETTQAASEDKDPIAGLRVGILMPDLASETTIGITKDCRDYLEPLGVKVVSEASYDADSAKCIACIENLITDGVDGILMMPVDPSCSDAIKEAMDAGIAVITVGNVTDYFDVFITVDNYNCGYAVGEMAAEWVKENFDGKADICTVSIEDSVSMAERGRGIRDAITELVPESTIVYNIAAVAPGEGTAAAENLFTVYPDCQVIASFTDRISLEIYEVMKAANLITDKTAIFGADGDAQAIKMIAEGGIYKGTVGYGAAGSGMGEAFVSFIKGEIASGTTIPLGNVVITQENAAEFLK